MYNKIFYTRLTEEIKNSGKSMNRIERELGYPRNALHNYKRGAEPSGVRLLEISSFFSVTPEYLIGKTKENSLLSPEKYFESLNQKQKKEILDISKRWFYKINK